MKWFFDLSFPYWFGKKMGIDLYYHDTYKNGTLFLTFTPYYRLCFDADEWYYSRVKKIKLWSKE